MGNKMEWKGQNFKNICLDIFREKNEMDKKGF